MKASVALLILFTIAAAGCTRGAGSDEASDPPGAAAVRVRAADRRLFDDVVMAPGQWRSVGELTVNAPSSGILDSLGVQLGDAVADGQLLGHLTTRESQASLRGASLLAREARSDAARTDARRALDLARRELVRVPVIAPRAGIVVRVACAAGGEVAEGNEILAILPSDGIVFEARIDPAIAPRVRVGQPATIEDGRAGPREVAVSRVLPFAGEGDQRTLFWLSAKPGGAAPQIGRFGEARIRVGAPYPACAVPDSAIVQDDLTGISSVAVVRADHTTLWTPVVLGPGAMDGWRELKNPALAPGTLIVTQGQRGLPDSTRVQWSS
jgi:multidrug efflux pump subunit AcrA (membrane-fusion protein)